MVSPNRIVLFFIITTLTLSKLLKQSKKEQNRHRLFKALSEDLTSVEVTKHKVAARFNKLLMLDGPQNTINFWADFLLDNIPIKLPAGLEDMTHEKAEEVIQEFTVSSFPDLNQLDSAVENEALKTQYLSNFDSIIAKVRELSHAEAIHQFQQIRSGISKDTLELKSLTGAVGHALQQKLNEFIEKFNIKFTQSETEGLNSQINAAQDKVRQEVYNPLAEILKAVLNGLVYVEAELYEFLNNVENNVEQITEQTIEKSLFILELFEKLCLKTDKDALFEFRHHLTGLAPVFRIRTEVSEQVNPRLIKFYQQFLVNFLKASVEVAPMKDIYDFLKHVVGNEIKIIKLEESDVVMSAYFKNNFHSFILTDAPKSAYIESLGDTEKRNIIATATLLALSEYDSIYDEWLITQVIPNVNKIVVDDITRDLLKDLSETISTTFTSEFGDTEYLKVEFIFRFLSQFNTQVNDSIFIDLFEFVKRFMTIEPKLLKDDKVSTNIFKNMKKYYAFVAISILTSARGDPELKNEKYQFKLLDKAPTAVDKEVIPIYTQLIKKQGAVQAIFSTPIKAILDRFQALQTNKIFAFQKIYDVPQSIEIMTKPVTVKETTTVESKKEARERQKQQLINVMVSQENMDMNFILNSVKLSKEKSIDEEFDQNDISYLDEEDIVPPVQIEEPIKNVVINTDPVNDKGDEHKGGALREIEEDVSIANPVVNQDISKTGPITEEVVIPTTIKETPVIHIGEPVIDEKKPIIKEEFEPLVKPLLFPEGVIHVPQQDEVIEEEILENEDYEEELLDEVESNQPTLEEIVGPKIVSLKDEIGELGFDESSFDFERDDSVIDNDEEEEEPLVDITQHKPEGIINQPNGINDAIIEGQNVIPKKSEFDETVLRREEEGIEGELIENESADVINDPIKEIDSLKKTNSVTEDITTPQNRIHTEHEEPVIIEEPVKNPETLHFDTPQERKNFIHHIRDSLSKEDVQAIEGAPDLVEFVKNIKIVKDPKTGEETHYYYIQIIPYMSDCYKALKLKKSQGH